MSDSFQDKHTQVEHIKAKSNFLRGTIEQSLRDGATGGIAEDDTQLSKFHGIYQQDDRDVRDERRRQMLEPDVSFMIRARVPGGVCSPAQWLALDEIATRWANNTLRLTTRQAFQLHGVLKRDLKTSIQEINHSLLDTIAACGDVNRNVMCTPLPESSAVHRKVFADAATLSKHLTPGMRAYHEIWLDKKKVAGSLLTDAEPIYGATYLPRKFKIAFVIPPRNDVDVLAHDLGFIAITNNKGRLAGYNITVGGGMGVTHNDHATFPRLADVLGFCKPQQVNPVAEAIVKIQRDFGNRSNRKHARFKYTLADRGLDWLVEELASRKITHLEQSRPFVFTTNGDRYGWQQSARQTRRQSNDNLWHLLLHIENGRIVDCDQARHLIGMREIARVHKGEFRLTPNQNVILANVRATDRAQIDKLVDQYGLDGYKRHSLLRLNALACVALPTCGLAMAEAERYLPGLIGHIDKLLENHGLGEQPMTIRMTGCPNGCARPYIAEIGLIGKAPGRYNLHLGAAFNGTRLNHMVRENANEAEILETLDAVFGQYAKQRESGEGFGDFITRRFDLYRDVNHV